MHAWIHSRRGRRQVAVWLGLLVIVVAVVVAARRPPTVTVATVQRGDLAAEVEGTGTVTADAVADLAPRITGRVEQVYVDEGDVVHKGQRLALLDQGEQHHGLDAARARLGAATATARERRHEWQREQGLITTGAVGKEEAQQYQERDAVAQGAMDAAKAELALAQYRLSLTDIRSLSDGVVTRRWVVPGAAVVPGQAMFTVADTNLVYVDTHADQSAGGELRRGQPATVLLRGHDGQPLHGNVLRIRPRADATTEETVAQVRFPWPLSWPFQLGQWANVFVQVRTAKDALLIPRPALMPMNGTDMVWVVDARERVRAVPVRVMASSPRSPTVAVSGALRAGDHVVLMSMAAMSLRAGQKVRASSAAPKSMAGAMR